MFELPTCFTFLFLLFRVLAFNVLLIELLVLLALYCAFYYLLLSQFNACIFLLRKYNLMQSIEQRHF